MSGTSLDTREMAGNKLDGVPECMRIILKHIYCRQFPIQVKPIGGG